MFIDPEHKRARELRSWYEIHKGKNLILSSVTINSSIITSSIGLSTTNGGLSGSIGPGGERPDNFKLAEELIEELQNPPARITQSGTTIFSDALKN